MIMSAPALFIESKLSIMTRSPSIHPFSAAAFIIAFVLTSSMEEAFRQSMIISDKGFFVFTSFEYGGKFSYAPIFLIIGAAVVIFRTYSSLRSQDEDKA